MQVKYRVLKTLFVGKQVDKRHLKRGENITFAEENTLMNAHFVQIVWSQLIFQLELHGTVTYYSFCDWLVSVWRKHDANEFSAFVIGYFLFGKVWV